MKIAILSSFYPYRGGIAQFNANLYNELRKTHSVNAYNFKRQYPTILFPGKTQLVQETDSAIKVESVPILDSANPISYITSAKIIRNWNPDLLLMRYWMSYFAPSQGYVGRNQNSGTKVISILDNVIPHEERFFDKPFTKYYLNSNDGFIVLSDAVRDQLLKFKPNAKFLNTPHPVYNHFGNKIERELALSKLKIDSRKKVILFFGLIREYKGLDILIDAFSKLDNSYHLIIAGEAYGSFDLYETLINNSPLKENISLFNKYISDDEVPLFFSASDVCVLPYRSATQSGISAVSSHFELPLITTNVGGLKESIEKPGTGIVVDRPDSELIAKAIKSYFDDSLKDLLKTNIYRENQILSWENFANKLLNFYKTL